MVVTLGGYIPCGCTLAKYARVIRVMIIAMTFEHHLKKVDLKKKGDHEKKANH